MKEEEVVESGQIAYAICLDTVGGYELVKQLIEQWRRQGLESEAIEKRLRQAGATAKEVARLLSRESK